jgi:hypothetical protein
MFMGTSKGFSTSRSGPSACRSRRQCTIWMEARRRLTASPMPAETDMEPGSRPRPMARPPYPTHTLRRTPSWLVNCLPIYSSGILASRSSAVRARSFCNGKTLVNKRTIVLKKLSGFLDSYQYDSTLVRPSRCCSIVLGQGRSRLGRPFVSLVLGGLLGGVDGYRRIVRGRTSLWATQMMSRMPMRLWRGPGGEIGGTWDAGDFCCCTHHGVICNSPSSVFNTPRWGLRSAVP